jgi:hypothetical protein
MLHSEKKFSDWVSWFLYAPVVIRSGVPELKMAVALRLVFR